MIKCNDGIHLNLQEQVEKNKCDIYKLKHQLPTEDYVVHASVNTDSKKLHLEQKVEGETQSIDFKGGDDLEAGTNIAFERTLDDKLRISASTEPVGSVAFENIGGNATDNQSLAGELSLKADNEDLIDEANTRRTQYETLSGVLATEIENRGRGDEALGVRIDGLEEDKQDKNWVVEYGEELEQADIVTALNNDVEIICKWKDPDQANRAYLLKLVDTGVRGLPMLNFSGMVNDFNGGELIEVSWNPVDKWHDVARHRLQQKLLAGSNITLDTTSPEYTRISANIPDALVEDVKVDGTSVVTDKVANIDLSGKQDTLVSGTNIKTINGTSVLGAGDIEITGSGLVDDVKVDGVSVVTDKVANIDLEGKLADYATTTYVDTADEALDTRVTVNESAIASLSNGKQDKATLETDVAAAGFIKEVDLSDYAKTADVEAADAVLDGKITDVADDIQAETSRATNIEAALASSKQNKLVAGDNITIDPTTNEISATAGSPEEYIKSASVSGNTLTLVDQDDENISFTPAGAGGITDVTVNGSSVVTSGVANITIDEPIFTYDMTLNPSTGVVTINSDNHYEAIMAYYEEHEAFPVVTGIVHIQTQPDLIIVVKDIVNSSAGLYMTGFLNEFDSDEIGYKIIEITTNDSSQSAIYSTAAALTPDADMLVSAEVNDNTLTIRNNEHNVIEYAPTFSLLPDAPDMTQYERVDSVVSDVENAGFIKSSALEPYQVKDELDYDVGQLGYLKTVSWSDIPDAPTIPEIIANPSGTATEALSKLDINGTIYTIGGSSIAWTDITGKPFNSVGTGLRIDTTALTFDPSIIASVTYVENQLATKQDTISDLSTIRSGAAAGATALQPDHSTQTLVFTMEDDTTVSVEVYTKEA